MEERQNGIGDFTSIEFWDWSARENYGIWRSRVDASNVDPYPHLTKHLNSQDPSVRAKAVNALYNLRQVPPVPPREVVDLVLRLMKDDAHDEVVDRACVFCKSYKIKAFKPILMDRLAKLSRENPDRLFRLVEALEALDAIDALPLIVRQGRESPFLARFSTKESKPLCFPQVSVGEYVNVSVGHSPLISGRKGPPCPLCQMPLPEIIRLSHPLGPQDRGQDGVPFFRCLSCVMHSPLFIRIGPPMEIVEVPDGDLYPSQDIRYVDHGEKWAVRWDMAGERPLSDCMPQLGGRPQWIQSDQTPSCPTCNAKMNFACQLGCQAGTFDIAEFGGVNYFFWCGNCRVTSSQFQTD